MYLRKVQIPTKEEKLLMIRHLSTAVQDAIRDSLDQIGLKDILVLEFVSFLIQRHKLKPPNRQTKLMDFSNAKANLVHRSLRTVNYMIIISELPTEIVYVENV